MYIANILSHGVIGNISPAYVIMTMLDTELSLQKKPVQLADIVINRSNGGGDR